MFFPYLPLVGCLWPDCNCMCKMDQVYIIVSTYFLAMFLHHESCVSPSIASQHKGRRGVFVTFLYIALFMFIYMWLQGLPGTEKMLTHYRVSWFCLTWSFRHNTGMGWSHWAWVIQESPPLKWLIHVNPTKFKWTYSCVSMLVQEFEKPMGSKHCHHQLRTGDRPTQFPKRQRQCLF